MQRGPQGRGRVVTLLALASCSPSPPDPPAFDEPIVLPPRHDPGTDDAGAHGGAGGGSDSRTPYAGGARLRAIHHETPDGLAVFAGYRDTQQGQACAFAVAGDGVLRCLPSGGGVASASTSVRYFADAACSRPIATYAGGPCATPPRTISISDASSCPSRSRQYAVGARVSGYAGYSRDDTGACVSVGFSTNTELYEIGVELAPSTWVAAREQAAPAVSGLARIDLVAEDGARGLSAFVDAARGASCNFRIAADGAARCVPSSAAYVTTSMFADAACSAALATRSTSSCPAPAFALASTQAGCTTQTRVHATGPSAAPYYASPTGCAPFASGISQQYYRVGVEVPASSFAQGSLEPRGAGGLRAVELVVRGGERYLSSIEEVHSGQRCSFRVAGDGAVRCVPLATAYASYFSDAGCSQRIASRFDASGCTVPDADVRALLVDESSCPPRARIFRVGARLSLSSVHVRIGETCYQMSPQYSTYYALGAEVPASELVEAATVER